MKTCVRWQYNTAPTDFEPALLRARVYWFANHDSLYYQRELTARKDYQTLSNYPGAFLFMLYLKHLFYSFESALKRVIFTNLPKIVC